MAKRTLCTTNNEEEVKLIDTFREYVELLKEVSPKGNKPSGNSIVFGYLRELLDGKILTNTENIPLEVPMYFDNKQLIETNEVVATKEDPISNIEKYVKIYAIPNNLDTFTLEHKTYCYGKPNDHLGIDVIAVPKKNPESNEVDVFVGLEVKYIQYKYIDGTLKIGLTTPYMLDENKYGTVMDDLNNKRELLENELQNKPLMIISEKYTTPDYCESLLHTKLKKTMEEDMDKFKKKMENYFETSKINFELIKEKRELRDSELSDLEVKALSLKEKYEETTSKKVMAIFKKKQNYESLMAMKERLNELKKVSLDIDNNPSNYTEEDIKKHEEDMKKFDDDMEVLVKHDDELEEELTTLTNECEKLELELEELVNEKDNVISKSKQFTTEIMELLNKNEKQSELLGINDLTKLVGNDELDVDTFIDNVPQVMEVMINNSDSKNAKDILTLIQQLFTKEDKEKLKDMIKEYISEHQE